MLLVYKCFSVTIINFLLFILVLKTCHEFMIAGLTGVKYETIDADILDEFDNTTIMECNLDLGN